MLTIQQFKDWRISLHENLQGISCIYMIEIENKFYIGLTTDIYKRMKNHIGDVNKRQHYPLYKAIKNNGLSDCKVYILHTCDDFEELRKLEIEEIENRNTLYPYGLNANRGGAC